MGTFGDFIFGKKSAEDDGTAVAPHLVKLGERIARGNSKKSGAAMALASGAPDGVDAFLVALRQRKFFDTARPGRIVRHVLAQKNKEMLDAVCGPVAHVDPRYQEEIIAAALGSGWDEGAVAILRHIELTESTATAALYMTLTYQQVRSEAACAALMASGIDVHYNNGLLLMHALYKSNLWLADMLIKAGFDARLYHDEIKAFFKDRHIAHGTRVYLQDKLGFAASGGAPALPPPARNDDGVTPSAREGVVGATYVTRTALPDGGRLSVVFNFSLRQQYVFVENGQHISPPTVTPFNAVPAETLQEATRAFLADGGDAVLLGTSIVAPPKLLPPT